MKLFTESKAKLGKGSTWNYDVKWKEFIKGNNKGKATGLNSSSPTVVHVIYDEQ